MAINKVNCDFTSIEEEEARKSKKPRTVCERGLQGNVSISLSNGKSEITESYSTYPLKIMQQEPWNSHVTLSLLGYGGGMISGDFVSLKIAINEKAIACIKTVGSTKIFKSVEDHRCCQDISVNLSEESFVVMVPDPITCYEHSNFTSKQRYIVHENSSAVIVDWFTSGRLNKEEVWKFDSFENNFVILNQKKEFLLVENQYFPNNSSGKNSISFGSLANEFQMNVCGMLVLYGPKTEFIRSSLRCFQNRQTFEERSAQKHSIPLLSVNRKNSQLTIVRFMIPTIQYAYELLMEILRPLSTELNGNIPYQDRVHYQSDAEHDPSSPIEILKAYRHSL